MKKDDVIVLTLGIRASKKKRIELTADYLHAKQREGIWVWKMLSPEVPFSLYLKEVRAAQSGKWATQLFRTTNDSALEFADREGRGKSFKILLPFA